MSTIPHVTITVQGEPLGSANQSLVSFLKSFEPEFGAPLTGIEADQHANELKVSYGDAEIPQIFVMVRGAEIPLRHSQKTPPLTFGYTNYRGEYAVREAIPLRFEYRVSEWHGDQPQHIMVGWDIEKQAERDFLIEDMQPLGNLRKQFATMEAGNDLVEALAQTLCAQHGAYLHERPAIDMWERESESNKQFYRGQAIAARDFMTAHFQPAAEKPTENPPQESAVRADLRKIYEMFPGLTHGPIDRAAYIDARRALWEFVGSLPAENPPQQSAVPAASGAGKLPEALHDFATHRSNWRKAMERLSAAAHHDCDVANYSYWEHELWSYDRAVAALDAYFSATEVHPAYIVTSTPAESDTLRQMFDKGWEGGRWFTINRNQTPERVQELLETNTDLLGRLREAEEGLFLFREFAIRNARAWELGAAHYHPIWAHVAEILHENWHAVNINDACRWAFIYPTNTKTLELLREEAATATIDELAPDHEAEMRSVFRGDITG